MRHLAAWLLAAGIGLSTAHSVQMVSIVVGTGAYTGEWMVNGVFRQGPATLTLSPGSHQVTVGEVGSFSIGIDSDGVVSVPNGVSATGGLQTLTFATTPVTINPGAYTGQWGIDRSRHPNATGIESLTLVPGLRYQVRVGEVGPFLINVAGDGMVSVGNGVSGTGGLQTLTFATTTMTINPGAYTGQWGIDRVRHPNATGIESLTLVPGLRYQVRVGEVGPFLINVAGDGMVSVENGVSGTGGLQALTFVTTTVTVNPGAYTGQWSIDRVTSQNGNKAVILVSGVAYWLRVGADTSTFSVTVPCAINPPQVTVNGKTFGLSCGQADADADGVPDISDNCPALSNADQIDQDLDGVGNACDLDLDGDGSPNAGDNCPTVANDQADADGDGTGNACDDDRDGDGIGDSSDNCVAVPNLDQSDTDGDRLGNACDNDDDGDAVLDSGDNCPVIPNADQMDQDGDVSGDACDADVDGDGVLNGADVCAASPTGVPIGIDGCSGLQSVARKCSRSNFVQHGQYVSCVAHASNEAKAVGLLTEKQRAQIVREAAQK